MQHEIPTILRFNDLKMLLKVSRSSLDRWEKSKGFPKRIRIGENSVGWRSDEVHKWLMEKK